MISKETFYLLRSRFSERKSGFVFVHLKKQPPPAFQPMRVYVGPFLHATLFGVTSTARRKERFGKFCGSGEVDVSDEQAGPVQCEITNLSFYPPILVALLSVGHFWGINGQNRRRSEWQSFVAYLQPLFIDKPCSSEIFPQSLFYHLALFPLFPNQANRHYHR